MSSKKNVSGLTEAELATVSGGAKSPAPSKVSEVGLGSGRITKEADEVDNVTTTSLGSGRIVADAGDGSI